MPRLPRSLARVFPILLAVSLVPAMLLARIDARLHALGTSRAEDVYLLPRPDALAVLALGHREAAAGLVWTRALVYFGEEVAARGRLEYLGEHVDAVIGLDPDFREVYEWAGVVTVYNSREITRESIEASNHYLELGVRRFPSDAKLLSLLGFNYAVEMIPFARSDEEKTELRARAAALFERAARASPTDRSAALMAAELYTRAGQEALARRHLEQLYVLTDDPSLRRAAAERLAQMLGDQNAEDALAEGRALFEDWTAEYPYLPPDLYVLVRPKRLSAGGGPPPDDAPDAGPDAAP